MIGSPLAVALATRGSARYALGDPGWREDLNRAVAMAPPDVFHVDVVDPVAERGAQRDHRLFSRECHKRSIGLTDQVVMRDLVTAQLIGIASLERQGILTSFLIDQMNPLAVLQP